MKAFRKVFVIMLAVMMTATMMLPDFYGGFLSYAENEAVTEESADGQTEDVGGKDSSGKTEESADVEKASEEAAEEADTKEDASADKKADKGKEAGKAAKDPVELSFEGDDFDVSVSADEKSGLTMETGLEVKEIKSGKKSSKEYKEYESLYNDSLDAVQSKKAVFAKFYDITLTDADGKETEPSADVDVSIKFSDKLAKKLATEGKGDVSIVHFIEDEKTGETKAELIGQDTNKKDDVEATIEEDQLKEVNFKADSFSVYGIIYTVDFHYGDGTYDFSIAGESSIKLSEIFERLHIDDIDMADIESVEFSDPELIKVEKKGDDWLLISLKPFDTEETLTVKLNEGSTITISVTDQQRYSEAEATYKVTIRPSNPTSITYWDTFAEAVNAANNGSGLYPAKIDVLDSANDDNYVITPVTVSRAYDVTIDGHGHWLTRGASNTSSALITKTGNNKLIFNNITLDGDSVNATGSLIATTDNGILECNSTTLNAAKSTGTVVSAEGRAATFSNCKINGPTVESTSPLVSKSTNYPISFSNTVINGNSTTGDLVTVSGANARSTLSFTGCTINASTNSSSNSLVKRNGAANSLGTTSFTDTVINGGNNSGTLLYIKGDNNSRQCIVTMTGCTVNCQQSTGSVLAKAGTDTTAISGCNIYGTTENTASNIIDINGTSAVSITDGTYIYRGATTGSAVSNSGTGAMTINNATISGSKSASDNSSVSAEKALVVQGSGALTLTSARIEKHNALTGGVCAVDAVNASAVNVSGNTRITDNIGGGSAANLAVNGIKLTVPTGTTFAGTIGVYSADRYASGEEFANRGSATSSKVNGSFTNDRNPELEGVVAGTHIYWTQDKDHAAFYIIGTHSTYGAGTRINYKSLDEALAGASKFTATVNIYGMVSESTMNASASTPSGKAVTIQPGKDARDQKLSRITVKRGDSEGDLITANAALTITNVTFDGENETADGSLLKVAGNYALTLNGAKFENHKASVTGICAVDAESATSAGNVKVSGETTINGNIASGDAANLKVSGTNVLQIPADSELNGIVGVYTSKGAGQQFAALGNTDTSKGLWNFTNDKDDTLVPYLSAPTAVSWISKTTHDSNYRYYIKKNNAVNYYNTLEAALDAGGAIYCLVEEYTPSTAITATKEASIQPDPRLSAYTIKRGNVTGDLINSNKDLTLIDIVLDGERHQSSGSLLKKTDKDLTLRNVEVKGHVSSSSGVCAVDAANADAVYIAGSTKVAGNTANGSPANLKIPAAAQNTHFTSTITNEIGINTVNSNLGNRFARWSNNESSGWLHLTNDKLAVGTYVTYRDGSDDNAFIKWKDISGDYTAQDVENMFGNPSTNYPLKTAPNADDLSLVPQGAVPGAENEDQTNPSMVWKSAEYKDDNSVDIVLNYFQRQVNLKLDLIFVIDETGTMNSPVTANGYTQSQAWWARYASVRAAKGALDLNDTYNQYSVRNRAKIISWSSAEKVESDFIDDYDELLTFIGSYPAISGGTDPSYAVTYAREAVAQSRAEGRTPIVIWMSDMHVMNNASMANARYLRQEAEAVYAIMVFEEHPETYKPGMKLLTPVQYHYFSDNSDASKLITPIITVIKNAIEHCDSGMHIEDELGAATAAGADINDITSTDAVDTTADATYDGATDMVNWDLLTDDRALLEDEDSTEDIRLLTGKMYKKIINVKLSDGLYSGYARTNEELRVKNDDEIINTIDRRDSPMLKKPVKILVKSFPSPNGIVKPTEFTLKRGLRHWDLVSDSNGMITIPWAENDSDEAVSFPAGSTYTLKQNNTGDDNVLPAGEWTLNVDSETCEITSLPVQSDDEEANRTIPNGVSEGKLIVFNDVEPVVTYDANGGRFGNESTVKTDTVTFGNTDTSVEYNVTDDPAFIPTHTNTALVFVGWNTKADGRGDSYKPGEGNMVVYHGESDNFITLYAQWAECKNLTITNENYGDYANADDRFIVTLSLAPGSGQDPLTDDDDERLGWITGGSFNVSEGVAVISFEMNGIGSGDDAANTRTFVNIPKDWTYTVKMSPEKGYTPKYKLGTQADSAYAEAPDGKTGSLSDDTTVNIRNARETVVPSGLAMRRHFGIAAVVLSLVLAGALMKLLQLRRRHMAR